MALSTNTQEGSITVFICPTCIPKLFPSEIAFCTVPHEGACYHCAQWSEGQNWMEASIELYRKLINSPKATE